MVGEEHAVHVPDLTFVPVGCLEDAIARIDGRQLIRVGFDADTRIEAQRQDVVDQLHI